MERFKEAIFKQKEEINKMMTEMFSLLKEFTKSNSLERVLVREEVRSHIDENIVEHAKLVDNEKAIDDEEGNEPNGNVNDDLTRWGKYADKLLKMPRSLPIGYYLKHKINEKIIEGLVDNHKYNYSLLATHLGKMDNEIYNLLPVGPMYNVILKKKLVRKDERGGTPFLTTAKAKIKFEKGRMTIMARNCKIIFVKTLEHPSKIEERIKGDLDPIVPTNHVNGRIL
nr:hypothetical protein [Tanacetum cinerariifolium]